MARVYTHNVEFPTILNVNVKAPLDNRTVVEIEDDLTNETLGSTYPGMVVYVQEKQSLWLLVGNDSHDENNWKEIKDWTFIHDNIPQLEGIEEKIKKLEELVGSLSEIEKKLKELDDSHFVICSDDEDE